MKYRLLDLLACPMCKHFPITLVVFEEVSSCKGSISTVKKCSEFCGFKGKPVSETRVNIDCNQCLEKEISIGMLFCSACNRWYPIIDEIPQMLPDELRKENNDLDFIKRWQTKIPLYILRKIVKK